MRKNKNRLLTVNKLIYYVAIILSVSIVNKAVAVSIHISKTTENTDVRTLIENVLKWILSVAGSLTLLMLIAGGVLYITSSGNEQKVETAKKMITWTILGLILILASYSIIVMLDKILT
ncbi:MAG: hypothetical protein KAS78_02765 [Candidatus Pacebacteria bacterium]|nr:hypothetical protein [Candidatus Paceibacterota bacterium]